MLLLLAFCSAISVVWGFAVVRAAKGIIVDFDLIYLGSRATIEHIDPYDRVQIGNVYRAEGRPVESVKIDPSAAPPIVAQQVYLPTAILCVAPFALLPLTTAHLLWISVSATICTLAGFLIWTMAEKRAPAVAFYLIGFMLANCGVLFAGGNPAGPAVGLCVIAVWCFLNDRFIPIAIFCMAISLSLKPHDSGFIWLYFLLSGGKQRKRALWSLGVTCVLAMISIIWITPVAPHWIREVSENFNIISQRGGTNDPGPSSVQVGPGMVIDLQSVFSVFRDNPGFYNSLTYGISGLILGFWIFNVIRTRFSLPGAYLSIAAVSCLTMLPNYHRPHDARLILLTIPACALLLSERNLIGRIALALNVLAFFVVSDLPLAALSLFAKHWSRSTLGFGNQLATVALFRPVPIILLALAIFYLTLSWRRFRIGPQDFTYG
jgi:glycosyl transferase family 87